MNEIIYIQPTAPIDRLRDSGQKLGEWIDKMSVPKNLQKNSLRWSSFRSYQIDHYGNDSIVTLFPEQINKSVSPIVKLLDCLIDNGFRTKDDLISVQKKFLDKCEFSSYTKGLTLILYEIALAEKDLNIHQI